MVAKRGESESSAGNIENNGVWPKAAAAKMAYQ
jgi:hypothetical protein